jgi:hypothetical protein
MDLSRDGPAETEARLRRVVAEAALEILPGAWWFDELPLAAFPARVRPDAVALVRDGNCWSQLVPVRSGDAPAERVRLWCFHFPAGLDNSGFVGWLATQIKRETGSGVLVVCGHNSARGGIYDYWGCPERAAGAVLAAVGALRQGGSVEIDTLEGLEMMVSSTAAQGVVGPETRIRFSQRGSRVLGRYAGGRVVRGCLVGQFSGRRLTFRYLQREASEGIHGGESECEVYRGPLGRVRIMEHFRWTTRVGSGTNVFEEASPHSRS